MKTFRALGIFMYLIFVVNSKPMMNSYSNENSIMTDLESDVQEAKKLFETKNPEKKTVEAFFRKLFQIQR